MIPPAIVDIMVYNLVLLLVGVPVFALVLWKFIKELIDTMVDGDF